MDYYSDDDDDADNHVIGTPLPPLEDDEIVSKKPEIDLTVRDSKGRRRFHGAFTGGFSAGYWNTVGSAEGFTPVQYVSSRNARSDAVSAVREKPEDFMDDEDFGAFGIAPKRVHTKDKFKDQQFAGFRDDRTTLIDVIKSVIRPSNESIGVKLFRQMKRKNAEERKRIYGCEFPSKHTDVNDNDPIPFCIYKPKADFHGIGYKSLNIQTDGDSKAKSSAVSAVLSGGRKIKISGEAFDYGTLEDDNEDDAVVYHYDDISQYDFAIGRVSDDKEKEKHKKSLNKLREPSSLATNNIKGFVKSELTDAKLIFSHKYPIPILPREWKPKTFVKSKPRKSRWDLTNDKSHDYKGDSDTQKSLPPVMNANLRAVILGEEIVHQRGVKTVKEIKLKNEEKTDKTQNDDSSIEEASQLKIDQKSAFKFTPLTGFFGSKFVRSSDAVEDNKLIEGLNKINYNTKGNKSKDDDTVVNADMSVERITYEWHPHTLLCRRFNIANPYPQFPDTVGVVTVGKSDIKNRTSLSAKKKHMPNIFDCLLTEYDTSEPKQRTDDTDKSAYQSSEHKKIESKTVIEIANEEENDDEENDVTKRPPMDLFKAIFASDESDNSDSEDNEHNESDSNKLNDNTKDETQNDQKELNNHQQNVNNTPVSGIFANIDFEQLNKNFNPVINTNAEVKLHDHSREDASHPIPVEKPIVDDDFYGPTLPPSEELMKNSQRSSSSDRITHKRKKKKNHKHKAKKHKKHSSKAKSKHKKHYKRDRSSESSESDSEDDIKLLQLLRSSRK